MGAAPVGRRGRGRVFGLAGAAVACGALVGLLVWVSLWLHPAGGTCLVMLGAGYEDNLAVPTNAVGWEGLQVLAGLAQGQPRRLAMPAGRLRLLHPPRELLSVDGWDRGLKGIREKTIVLFLALHGAADRQGAYLLAQSAQAAAEDSAEAGTGRLRLEKVLDRLAQVPHGQNVVLVLDATGLDACWPLGIIHNAFAQELDRLEPRIAGIPNLVVVSASAANQRSWASAELRRTAFAHYFIEGLAGAADGAGGRPRDGRIDALELFDYVAAHVQHWAAVNRGALQTPVLYPHGEMGRERARAMQLAAASGRTRTAAGTVFEPPAGLLHEWQICDEIRRQAPSPAVYTPQLWRRYQDTLLRYEQLLQARAEGPARKLQGRLRTLEEQMRKGRTLVLASLQNTLAMPAVTGTTGPGARTLAKAVAELSTAGPKDFAKTWAAVAARHAPGGRAAEQLLRLRCCEFLLRQLAEGSGDLESTARLLRLLDDPGKPRPAEAHLLVMLERDLPRAQGPGGRGQRTGSSAKGDTPAGSRLLPVELLQLALRVRIQAERAALGLAEEEKGGYAYAEQVTAWIRPAVEEADAWRRQGQDLLFTADRQHWDEAQKLLHQAAQRYTEAEAAAGPVRHALAVRDDVLSTLPYFAQWAAHRGKIGKVELAGLVESLFAKTHGLAVRLESPPAGGKESLQSLASLADDVQKGFRDMEELFQQHINHLEQADVPAVWQAIDDALAVPFRDARLRATLLARQSQIAARLLVEQERTTGEAPAPTAIETERLAQEAGAREGRLALAALGQGWFDECSGKRRETFAQVRRRLDTFVVEARWWESLTEAGEQVGLRWRHLPWEVAGLMRSAAKSDIQTARAALRRADRLARLVEGAGSLVPEQGAGKACRRLRLADLLLWQGKRTVQDYWAAAEPGRPPYYRSAGQLFLDDARQALPRHPGVDALARKLAGMGRLELAVAGSAGKGQPSPAAAPIHLTSEDELTLRLRLAASGGEVVPPGFPVLSFRSGASLAVIAAPGSGVLAEPWRDGNAPVVTCTITSPLPRQAEAEPPVLPQAVHTDLQVRGLYRGHPLELRVPIDVHPLADNILTRHPLPPRAGLAIRGPRSLHERFAVGGGALAIVLDCSRSMGPPRGQEFGSTTKFAQATAALRQVLRKLPRGTMISLWVFGQAVGPEKTAPTPEDTITRLQAPVAWDPDSPAQLDELMHKVEWPALEPWNQSPIIHAMVQAARTDLKDARGPKTLLVITDGMDNRFDQDNKLNPDHRDIRSFFRDQFRDVEVNVIGFRVTNKELARAREQFQVVEDLPLPGKFYTVGEGGELAVIMERVLRQKLRYWVDQRDNHPYRGNGADVLYLSEDDANDQWLPGGLKPGTYKVRVKAGRQLTRTITVEKGDLLLLELNPDRGTGSGEEAPEFERLLYSQTFFPWKPKLDRKDWRLAVVQEQWRAQRALEMLVTLERKHDPQASVLQQIRPVKVWMDVAPRGPAAEHFCQRWHYQTGYPGPAWGIDVPKWPTRGGGVPLRPQLRVWWSPDQEPAGGSLERGHDFAALADLKGRTLHLKDEDVRVESVRVEEHLVEISPAAGERPARREKRPCLVVRLAHAKDRPVWVRVRGPEIAGAEHRFYQDAGKYTGLFWPVTREQAEQLLRGVEVFSLAAFKETAQKRDFALHLADLYEPQVTDVRPLPPPAFAGSPVPGEETIPPPRPVPVTPAEAKKAR